MLPTRLAAAAGSIVAGWLNAFGETGFGQLPPAGTVAAQVVAAATPLSVFASRSVIVYAAMSSASAPPPKEKSIGS